MQLLIAFGCFILFLVAFDFGCWLRLFLPTGDWRLATSFSLLQKKAHVCKHLQ